MAKFKINDVELELDIADVKTADRVENVIKQVQDDSAKKQLEAKSYSDVIHAVCGIVDRCFDALFGADTSEKLFHGQQNFRTSMNAFVALTEEVNRQKEELSGQMEGLVAKYSPNRAERRHTAKK